MNSFKCENWSNKRTSLKNDDCEKSWKDTTNKLMSNYAFGVPISRDVDQKYLCELGLHQQIPVMVPDNSQLESEFRNGCSGNIMTHTGARQSLNSRPYRTVPFMGECRSPLMDTDTYSKLVVGETTRVNKSCDVQSSGERWEPQVPCIQNNIQDPVHHIPEFWVRGGLNTSSYYRNIDYLQACGIRKPTSDCQQIFNPEVRVSERVKRQKMHGMNLPCFPGSIPLRGD